MLPSAWHCQLPPARRVACYAAWHAVQQRAHAGNLDAGTAGVTSTFPIMPSDV
jgi:hypothetical protein